MADPLESMGGLRDDFQRLWTPHRLVYLRNGQQPPENECPFCLGPEMSDEDGLIVRRGSHCFVLLNLFPYNTGHMLVCPYRHFSTYDDATQDEMLEMGKLTKEAMRTLRSVMGAHGLNIGMNQGEVAGAGIAGHLHQHIVPRWANDSNFFPIIAKSRALPILLGEVRVTISEGWVSDT